MSIWVRRMSSSRRSVSRGRSAAEDSRHVDQVVGDDPEADPAMHAVDAMIATASESMSPFDHTDAPFATDAAALAASKPRLAFIRTPGRRFRPAPRQNHSADAAVGRRLFIRGGAEAAIAGGEMRRAAEDGLVPIQCRGPQGDIGRSSRMHLIGSDDLMFRFLERDQIAKFIRLRNLALPNRRGVRFKETDYLIGTCVSPPNNRARVCATTRRTSGRSCCSCAWAR